MYQVFTQPKPGRPGLALATTAILLLLTVGFASLVIQHKTRGQLTPLTPPKVYDRGELRCRLPSGWKESSNEDNLKSNLLPGVIVAASEPATDYRRGRQLFVIRGMPHPYGLPSDEAASLIKQFLERLSPDLENLQLSEGNIGPLPGWTLKTDAKSPLGSSAIYCLARAAIAPRGETVGLVLIVPDTLRSADRQLLDQLSDSVELLNVKTADPQEVLKAAGIRFPPPSGATFFAETLGRAPRVQMCGGRGNSAWFAMAYRVPLVGSRTPEALLQDFGRSALEPADTRRIEKQTVAGRELASLTIGAGPGKEASFVAFAARTDEDTGLVLLGRCEREISELKQRLAEICGAAQVEPYSTYLDPVKAQDAAQAWLKQLADKGLTDAWGGYETRAQEYTIRSPGIEMGHASRMMRRNGMGSQVWWEVLIQENSSLGYELVENWRIRDDAAAHRLVSHLTRARQTVKYTEERAPNVPEVHRELVPPDGKPETYSTPLNDRYACDLVLQTAAGQLALQRDAKPAIFSSTDAFTRGLPTYVLLPLGALPLPGNPQRSAAAVQIQSDYDPQPVFLYFDESQTLLALAFDSGSWRTLTRNSAQGGDTGQ